MLLDSKIRGAHEHFEQVYAARGVRPRTTTIRVVAPVALAFDIYKDKDVPARRPRRDARWS